MSGYGYYDEEGSGLLSSIIGGNQGGLYTGGGTRSFAVARTGLPGRAAYIQKGYYAPRLPALQWGIRRVLRQVINKQNPSAKKHAWMNIARRKMEEAKREYFNSLPPAEQEAYINRQARVQAQKERKRQKVDLIRQKLESLKGATMDETANNIRNALIMEGATKARLLRSALKALYPNELLGGDEAKKRQVREQLKKYNFAGARRPPKAFSSLDYSRALGRIPLELIEEKKKSIIKSLAGPPIETSEGTVEEITIPPPSQPKTGSSKKKQ
jgi:glutamyl/glutaminyl-tRNA synthetase